MSVPCAIYISKISFINMVANGLLLLISFFNICVSVTQNKENKEVKIIDPNPNNNSKTKKNYTGFYTEVNPNSSQLITDHTQHIIASMNSL